MIAHFVDYIVEFVRSTGQALFFLGEVVWCVLRGKIRWGEVLKQIYQQGISTAVIIALASFASGAVLALQSFVMLTRFGASEYVAHLVALSLVRELSPVFSSFIFSGKAGARMTAELGTMKVNDQIMATRTMGVDPIEFLIVPRMVACFLILPGLIVFSEFIGIFGGYIVAVFDANVPGATYISHTLQALNYVDFFSGFLKTIFFALLIGWISCYQGYRTSGGSLGVGKFTTKAVAYSYILIVISNTILTKMILTFWG